MSGGGIIFIVYVLIILALISIPIVILILALKRNKKDDSYNPYLDNNSYNERR